MLSLSTRVRYATRALMDIATNSSAGRVPLHEISRRQGVSIKYLESIMPGLKTAGLVLSAKGPRGGYLLSRPPAEITLLDVISAFGGPVALVACVADEGFCEKTSACAAQEAWKELSEVMNSKLSEITIERLARRQREIDERGTALVYYI